MTGYALHKMIGVPTFLRRALKASVEMTAPAFGCGAEVSGEYLKGKRVNSVDTRGKETRAHLGRGNTG